MFQTYYDSRHNGRRLTWQGSLGTADIRVRFKARSHDLNVSTHALVVLLLFESLKDDETLSYSVSLFIVMPRDRLTDDVGPESSDGPPRR